MRRWLKSRFHQVVAQVAANHIASHRQEVLLQNERQCPVSFADMYEPACTTADQMTSELDRMIAPEALTWHPAQHPVVARFGSVCPVYAVMCWLGIVPTWSSDYLMATLSPKDWPRMSESSWDVF